VATDRPVHTGGDHRTWGETTRWFSSVPFGSLGFNGTQRGGGTIVEKLKRSTGKNKGRAWVRIRGQPVFTNGESRGHAGYKRLLTAPSLSDYRFRQSYRGRDSVPGAGARPGGAGGDYGIVQGFEGKRCFCLRKSGDRRGVLKLVSLFNRFIPFNSKVRS